MINNVDPNNVISVSQDGNELLIWGKYNTDGSPGGPGFSTTRRTSDAWSLPVMITNDHQANRASSREECLSADRSVMIAAREIDGESNGGKDLYVSFRRADGSYGELINLGEAVNTSGQEGAPYLAADGVTLYFNSTETTYGDADIFVTKRLDDTWRNWSPRINLGPTINTPFWDCYFTIHPSGEYAYMNTSYGANDGIFRLTLPQDAASRKLLPEPVVVVRGRVFNASTKQPLGVDIRYEDLGSGKEIGRAVSAPSDGRYSIVLKGGMNYGFFAEKDGFFPVSDNIELTSLKVFAEVERDLYLEPIVAGAVIRLNNLFFDTDKATIRPESGTELDRLAEMLLAKPTMSVAIEGHTDDRGATQHNAALSQARAEAVRTYLTSKGIDAARLTAKGYGKTKPLTKGTSDLDRQRNRRVEFRIVSL
jgi:outer membrane protein OmpA-like peptidoglycan-associated protein